MTQENLKQFWQMAAQDRELQEKLKAAIDSETFVKLVCELGDEKGYRFTKDQVEAVTAEAQLKRLGAELWSELSVGVIDENLEQFYQMAAQDQELLQKLKAVKDRETFVKLVCDLGEEKGYEFTKEQVEAATIEAQRRRLGAELWSDLSEEQLEAVAGGWPRFTLPTCGVGCVFLSVAGGTQCCAY